MTANGTPPPTNLDSQNQPQDTQRPDVHSLSASETQALGDSPEILRWRADILMDEMMLGAVDGLAHGSGNGHSIDGDLTENGTTPGTTSPLNDQSARQIAPTVDTVDDATAPTHALKPNVARYMGDTTPAASQAEAGGDEDWWQHPFRTPPTTRSDPNLPHSAAATSYFVGDTQSALSSAGDASTTSASAGADAGSGPLRPPSAVQSQSSTIGDVTHGQAAGVDRAPVDASAKGARKRSNLLPRASTVNTEALWGEIEEMRAEIDSVIPENHEWSVRSRHLLDKAETILRQSPDRTAEVEYYLNQVRGIRERVRQSFEWSQLYVRRLNVYLLAWISFAGVAALGCFLYRRELADFFMLVTGMTADNFLIQALPLWLSTLFVGALGGALGARYTMHRHKRLEHGFFDRKYSLRGLLLPLLAAFVASVLFIPFGLIAYFAPVSDAIALTLVLIAMLVAFLFGLFQQKLYGTDS